MSGGGAGLMSCVREGSLEPPYRPPHDHNHGEGRTGRFLRGLRRMFRRRGTRAETSPDPKSSSTSELLDAERHARRKEGAYGSGLSVSHDSVFTGERSGDESCDEPPVAPGIAQAAASHRAELVAAVRRRGRGECSDDEEDLGLPRSPPASPPTDKADKRHHAGISQSSCSDGSLLSVGSSEMDEDSSSGHAHDHSNRSDHSDIYTVGEPPSGVAPLSHSAARHKMAVRPRRTHPAPRRKKANQIAASALPITPELNEEMIRSTTPEVAHKTSEVVTESFSSTTTTKHQMIVKEQHLQLNRELQRVLEPPSDTKMKSSSLPPGLALGQAIQSPAKLSIITTPRSSIKRSKSSTQDQPLREASPKIHTSTSETYTNEERTTKEKKQEESSEKRSKSEKKIENEVIKSKKEESFFSRLLLRKSGKKSKKDQTDGEGQDLKKSKTEKSQYKVVDAERGECSEVQASYKPVPAERKNAGQKAFANQLHKRIDKQGAYVQDSAYKDVYSAAKVSGMEYNITDLKIAEETDVMLNLEMKSRYSRREEERVEKRRSREITERIDKRESFNLNLDKAKRPASVQRLMDPFPTKTFINNEINQLQDEIPDEAPIRAIRKPTPEYAFHSGSMPKNLYFNPSVVVSSPTKISQSSDNVKSTRIEQEYRERKEIKESFRSSHIETPTGTPPFGLRSLGDEYIETRSGIGKSHSFRYASECTSISSQENQMPSLPAIVGISEPLLESWEANYRRNVSERHDYSKRVSARNYNIQTNQETNYDSLPSTDSSYLDSLKVEEERKLFTSIHVTMDANKRDSDISQIEAKIDDIISSPKPIITPILKSNSLDSVKSSPEKSDRRKTISVESAINPNIKTTQKESKQDVENFVSVTHVNRELTPVAVKNIEASKLNKSDEKLQKTVINKVTGVPEFLNIQLNKVDAKPITNVVLTANVTPKKDPQQERENEIEILPVTETKIVNLPIFKENTKEKEITIVKDIKDTKTDNIENIPIEEKVTNSKSIQNQTPRSPSTPRNFFKRKSTSVELQDRIEKPRTNSLSTEGSTEKIYDNISMDRKSHSSYGSKSSIQSIDSIENRTSDKQEETVVYRKKPIIGKEIRGDRKRDDEPELMKVFARRSLKIKDTEADSLAQEIADSNPDANKSKVLKNEFNASIKSRDSDKENDDKRTDNQFIDIAARVSQYQRSASVHSVANVKRESAPCRTEASRYKKEISDSTPEKRLRNRTFPDPSNDREMAKSEPYRVDTLTKRSWRKDDFRLEKRELEGDGEKEKGERERERKSEGEADASPQFKGILQMRAEWERRAKQGMTK